MALALLLALHAVLSLAGFAYLWRRISVQKAEIAQLKAAVGKRERLRRASGDVIALPVRTAQAPASPLARAARAWGIARETRRIEYRAPTISAETGRSLTLALMAISPAAGFFFGGDASAIVASGLAIAAAMMLVALRPIWRSAAWAAVLTATTWAVTGFALGATASDPVSYAFCLTLAAGAGLTHAFFRRIAPGAMMALAMAAAALALGSQTSMISAPGIAFGVMVAAAAIVGAMSLRVEILHLAAFAAAVIGLFTLTGQPSAAIWFTPVAAWTGALFFAIAVVRVPRLGPRGVAIAGTGAFAPLGIIAAMHNAQHGLADNAAAAGAFLVFALLLAGVGALAASRRRTGFAALRFTLWVLSLGAFCALSAAIGLALPWPFAAATYGALAVGLAALNLRLETQVWRTFAVAAIMLAMLFAFVSARLLLGEAAGVVPWLSILAGVATPAAFAAAAALLFHRADAKATAGFFEVTAILAALAAAHLLVRLIFSGGATLLNPVGFVEAGVHSAVWLAVALGLGLRAHLGATDVRSALAKLLTYAAILASAAAALLWLTSFWEGRNAPALQLHETLGFVVPALLLMAHWAFWRWRDQEFPARLSLGLGALLLAAFVTAETLQARGVPDWAPSLIGATSFALAVGLNFVPGIERHVPIRPRGRAPSRAARRAAR